jgi:hypothetical protein
MKKTIIILILSFITLNTFALDPKLSEVRSKLKLPSLSNDEKVLIVDQASIIFEKFYVNLDHKKIKYNIDPVKDLRILKGKINELSEEEFHNEMIRIFTSVKDYHVNYYLPHPYKCYTSYAPIYFGPAGNKVAVSGFAPDYIISLGLENKISLGDELVSFNGLNAIDAIKKENKLTSGSTVGADFILGTYALSYKSQEEYLFPEENEINVTLKKASGEIISVTVPWYVSSYEKCLNNNEKVDKSGSNGTSRIIEQRNKFFKNITKKVRRFQLPFIKKNLLVSKNKIKNINYGAFSNISSNEDVSYKIIDSTVENRTYGVLKISSFRTGKSLANTMSEIKDILQNKFANTSALIIDLRGNYGGIISYAESLAALLYPNKTRPLPFYLKANEYTENITDLEPEWIHDIKNRNFNNQIVGPNSLITNSELKENSQIYFGKVVLITNGECFSSCDLFAATMKDNAGIKIYGRHQSTFGGGANVWKFNDISSTLKRMNLPDTLPAQMGMRFTFRHAHRLSTNTLIEDSGVASDEVVPTTIEDFLNPDSSSIVNKVVFDLDADTSLVPNSERGIFIVNKPLTIHGEEEATIDAYIKRISSLILVNDLNQSKAVSVSNRDQIDIPAELIQLGNTNLEIFGIDANSKKSISRKSIKIEKLLAFKEIENFDPIKDTLNITYPANNCGWFSTNNSWQLPANYCNNASMTLAMSLDLSNGNSHSLSFHIKGGVEEKFDSLSILVKAEDESEYENIIDPISGNTEGDIQFDLSKYSGKRIDIKFIVNADELGGGSGLEISNLVLK